MQAEPAFGKFMAWLVHQGVWCGLSGAAHAVYGVIVAYTNGSTLLSYPPPVFAEAPAPSIASLTGLHERSVQRAITELLHAGAIEVPGGRAGGQGKSTVFRLVATPPDTLTVATVSPNHAATVATTPPYDAGRGATPTHMSSLASAAVTSTPPNDAGRVTPESGRVTPTPPVLEKQKRQQQIAAAGADAQPGKKSRAALARAGVDEGKTMAELVQGLLEGTNGDEDAAVKWAKGTPLFDEAERTARGKQVGAFIGNLRAKIKTLIRVRDSAAARKTANGPTRSAKEIVASMPAAEREEREATVRRRYHSWKDTKPGRSLEDERFAEVVISVLLTPKPAEVTNG